MISFVGNLSGAHLRTLQVLLAGSPWDARNGLCGAAVGRAPAAGRGASLGTSALQKKKTRWPILEVLFFVLFDSIAVTEQLSP